VERSLLGRTIVMLVSDGSIDGTKAVSVASPGYEVVCEMRVERRAEGLKALSADRNEHRAGVSADSIAEVIDGAHHLSVAKQGAEQQPIDPAMLLAAQTQSCADGSGQCWEEAWSLAGAEELRTDEAIKRLRSIAGGHHIADDGK